MTELVNPAGEPVESYTPPTNGEVMKCGKAKCKTCHGTGIFKAWVYMRSMPCENLSSILGVGVTPERTGPCRKKCRCEPDSQIRVPRVCACAVKGWEKKHGKNILTGKPLDKPLRDSFTGKLIQVPNVQINP